MIKITHYTKQIQEYKKTVPIRPSFSYKYGIRIFCGTNPRRMGSKLVKLVNKTWKKKHIRRLPTRQPPTAAAPNLETFARPSAYMKWNQNAMPRYKPIKTIYICLRWIRDCTKPIVAPKFRVELNSVFKKQVIRTGDFSFYLYIHKIGLTMRERKSHTRNKNHTIHWALGIGQYVKVDAAHNGTSLFRSLKHRLTRSLGAFCALETS